MKLQRQNAGFFSQMCLPTPGLHLKPLQDLAERGAVQGQLNGKNKWGN